MTSHSWRNTPDCNVCDRNVPGSLAAIVTYRHMDTLYSYIHTYIHAYTYIYTHDDAYKHQYIHTYKYKQTNSCTYTYIHIYIYVCINI